MEFFDVIKKRTSISKYKDSKISKESIDKMIEAAMRAPSWKNRSAFRIIIVDDKDKKDEIAETIRNKDDKACNAVKEASIAMVIIAKPDDSGEVEGKDFYLVDGADCLRDWCHYRSGERYYHCLPERDAVYYHPGYDDYRLRDQLPVLRLRRRIANLWL